MDEFKREYSNKDTLKEALPYFWKNFEKDNYSIWYCSYKYNSELKRIFMTCNLIGGKFCPSLYRTHQFPSPTDRNDISEILLKVAFKYHHPNPFFFFFSFLL